MYSNICLPPEGIQCDDVECPQARGDIVQHNPVTTIKLGYLNHVTSRVHPVEVAAKPVNSQIANLPHTAVHYTLSREGGVFQ